MFICIPDVLSADQLDRLTGMMDRQSFIDGRETAGWAAAGVKNNRQVASSSKDHARMQAMVGETLAAHPIFVRAAMPRTMRPILFSRYLPGMAYGPHVDNALMGESPQTRIDLAFTLFLSGPDAYEGGELAVDEPAGTRAFKLPAGALVLYPANSLHQVTTVTSGRRDVAVGWLQSMVREHERRRIIFELETLRATMFAQGGKTAEFDALSRNVSDLWRMWIEN